MNNISRIKLEAELCKRSYYEFVKRAFPIAEQGEEYVDNWHIKVLCEAMEKFYSGEIMRLIVALPPGHMKTSITNVFFNAWAWANNPSLNLAYMGYNWDVASKPHKKFQQLVTSQWYQERFGNIYQIDKDNWNKTVASNNKGGDRRSDSLYGTWTGTHYHKIFVDDPLKAQDALNSDLMTKLDKCRDTFNTQIKNRVKDARSTGICVVMQRLHPEDLVGSLIKQGDWTLFGFPAEYVPGKFTENEFGIYDQRQSTGELLWGERFPQEFLNEQKKTGSVYYSAQYQQDPVPAEGNVFKKEWIKLYKDIPAERGRMIMTVDTAFGFNNKSDYTVAQVWMKYENKFYLLDQFRARVEYYDAIQGISQLIKRWPNAKPIYVELTNNGPAIVEYFKKQGLNGVRGEKTPTQSKMFRANAITYLWASGDVYLPEKAPWLQDFIDEICSFDNGSHDDQVDAMTLALEKLQKKNLDAITEGLSRRLGGFWK